MPEVDETGGPSGATTAPVWLGWMIVFFVVTPAVADESRDSDGSRLGAESQALETEQEDSLDPPDDESDWRYVEIESERTLEVGLSGEIDGESAELRLTSATGEELESSMHSGKTTRIRRELSPGVYYIEVTSDAAFDYTIAVE
jgi:hypothetical protein